MGEADKLFTDGQAYERLMGRDRPSVESQEVTDLYPAILSTVHVPDWFVEGILHRRMDLERGDT